jgi:hypothetical protein
MLDLGRSICANEEVGIAIWTGLSRDLDPDGEAAIRKTIPFWKDLDQGAATVLVAAFDPALNGECSRSKWDVNLTKRVLFRAQGHPVARLPTVRGRTLCYRSRNCGEAVGVE